MKKSVIFVILFEVAASFANDYTGICAPALGVIKNGARIPIEPTFSKSTCPTIDELYKGIHRYLEATNQTGRPYVIIEQEHGYILHFTDE